jgi:hypothetical protein
MADSRSAPIIPQVRKLVLSACAVLAAVALAGTAGAAAPNTGNLSVEQGKGVVTVEIKGSVLGRLAQGTIRVTDLTPRDRFFPVVLGRKLSISRAGAKTIVYKGQSLRFRMLGGRTKLVIKGSGISVSAVGRGSVILDGERRFPDDSAGFYSLDGVDCSTDATLCTPLPDLPEYYVIGPQRTVESRGA